jgi:predicted nucleotidyltransferase
MTFEQEEAICNERKARIAGVVLCGSRHRKD